MQNDGILPDGQPQPAVDGPTSGEKKAAVPDPIASLMGAKTFDIGAHRVGDFRAAARQVAGRSLTFSWGKPAGMSGGVAVLTKKTAHQTVNLVVRRFPKATKHALPTIEFMEPEMTGFLEQVHLIPVIDVTSNNPSAHVWPSRITGWDGYEKLFSAFANVNDEAEGLYIRYQRGGGDDPGGYQVENFPLEPQHVALWRSIRWPSPEDVRALVPAVPFDELLSENFNLKRAWAAVQQRKGAGA